MNKDNTIFTRQMKKTHSIYMPDMLHYHNELLCAAFKLGGYDLRIVPEYKDYPIQTHTLINSGYCTCATFIIGNILSLLMDPNIDTDHVAVLEPQAGGACRAGNYYDLIIQCVKKSGYKVPVLSLNFTGKESHPGFKINPPMVFAAAAAVCYGDLLMSLYQQFVPYEKEPGSTKKLHKKWITRLAKDISCGKNLFFREKLYQTIIDDFLSNPHYSREEKETTKVGVAGEIYIKFSPIGNKHLEDFITGNGYEYRTEGFLNYCIYVMFTEMKAAELNCASAIEIGVYKKILDYLKSLSKKLRNVMISNNLMVSGSFDEIKEKATAILSEYNNIGDGWLVLAEAMNMLDNGYNKILIVHPFGCLVSHVAERGVLKKLRSLYPGANINTIEYDFDQSDALRESRILLGIS